MISVVSGIRYFFDRDVRLRVNGRVLRTLAGKGARTTSLEDREAWLANTLQRLPAGSRILDAGAGEARYKSLCAHLKYVTQDFAQYDGKGDGTALQMGGWDNSQLDIVSDITAIPEPDGAFDAVMCIEVLEHVPSPLEALKELARLLRPKGTLILTAPFASLTHFAPYHFYSGFSRYFYYKWLEELGFNIVELTPNGNYFEYLRLELGRLRAIVNEYASQTRGLRVFEYGAIWILLRALRRFSRNDKGSHQVLCYGYHLVAVKR